MPSFSVEHSRPSPVERLVSRFRYDGGNRITPPKPLKAASFRSIRSIVPTITETDRSQTLVWRPSADSDPRRAGRQEIACQFGQTGWKFPQYRRRSMLRCRLPRGARHWIGLVDGNSRTKPTSWDRRGQKITKNARISEERWTFPDDLGR